MNKITSIVLIVSSLLVYACTNPAVITESKIDMPNYWAQKTQMDFPFEITDVNASYQLFYNIRYNSDYPYYNLWVNRIILDEKGNMISKKLQGMDLFHAASGEPYGAGFGNQFDYKILSDSVQKFTKPGMYTLRIEQSMRIDTLNGISSVGVEVVQNVK
jgi:gliding motility-associated lipoprotein GldH